LERLVLARQLYPNQVPPVELGHGQLALARIYAAGGRNEEAAALAQWVLDNLKDSELEMRMRSIAEAVLGQVAQARRQMAEAEKHYRSAEALDPKKLVVDHQVLLGRLLRDEKRFAEAEPVLLSLYRNAQLTMSADAPRIAEYRGDLVRLYEAWNKP